MPDLWKKLNLKDQDPILVLNPPESFNDHLKDVAPRTVYSAAGKVKEVEFFLAFVKTLKDVERATAWVAKKTQGDSVVWMAYPKQTSKKYNCEFHRDTGWDALERIGLRGVRQVAIDEDWSALRFRRCEYIK